MDSKKMIKAGINIIDGKEYQQSFIEISNITAEILSKTIGPYAHTTIIDDGSVTYSTKDGWNIITRLRFGDVMHNTLFNFIKQISFNLVSKVGDGTTTAIIAADSFINEIQNHPKLKQYRQRDILNTINELKEMIISRLMTEKYLHIISDDDFNDIYKIAFTSSNGNDNIASLIKKIYKETKNPNIYVNYSSDKKTSLEINSGYKLDVSPKLLNAFINTDNREFKPINKPLVFFSNHNITYNEHYNLIKFLNKYAAELNTTCIIFAPYFDDFISSSIRDLTDQYSKNGGLSTIMMVQVPVLTSTQQLYFQDAAMICHTPIFNASALKVCKDFWNNVFENSDKENIILDPYSVDIKEKYQTVDEYLKTFTVSIPGITVNKKFCLFTDYTTDDYTEYLNVLNEAKIKYEETKEKATKQVTVLNKDFMDATLRYTRLIGKMGIINVGGESELEKMCLKDSVDDAVLACRSAYENGYVKGLNLATINAINDILIDSKLNNKLTEIDRDILNLLYNTYRKVAFVVMNNKYNNMSENDKIWSNNTKSFNDIIDTCNKLNYGYDIVSEKFEYDNCLTVINSVSTDIEILNATISILSYVLTSNQLLSINQTYDKAIVKELEQENLEEKYSTIANIFADVIDKKINNYIKK